MDEWLLQETNKRHLEQLVQDFRAGRTSEEQLAEFIILYIERNTQQQVAH
jgi:hypothetical protein